MLDIDTLDTVIALVVVILLLSLIVQSIQGLLKKILKLKSKQIEASLLDLFTAVLRDRNAAQTQNEEVTRPTTIMPGAFAPSRAETEETPAGDPKKTPAGEPLKTSAGKLLDSIRKEMQELGRVSARGKFMVDSLSKSDLLNVIARVAPAELGANLSGALTAFKTLEDSVAAVRAQGLPDELSVAWAKFEAALAPLKQHYNALRTGSGTVAPGVIVADVLALRDVVFDDMLDLLAKVQETASAQKLTAVSASVAAVSRDITAAREALDASFGDFRKRLAEIEQWFDTTMQSFEERYHRGMRTYSMLIAAVVVILLNADVFSLYRNIAGNELLRANLTAAAPEILKLQEDVAEEQKKELEEEQKKDAAATATDTTVSATDTSASATDTSDTAASATTDTAAATDTSTTTTDPPASATETTGEQPETTPAKTTEEQIKEKKKELDRLVQMYTDFGLEPLTWDGFTDWVKGWRWDDEWASRRRGDLRTLFGWFIMTLLLSLGAPFWHDALESLFGVKNLLRRRTEQQNVEQAKGAGNPKP